MSRIVFFDVETGGLDPLRHPITQIAAVAVDERFREVETIERKLWFQEGDAESSALEMNHYDPETWRREAVSPAFGMGAFAELCRRHATFTKTSKAGRPYKVARLAAHNAPFDAGFVVEWFKASGTFLPAACYEALDTLGLARWASMGSASKPVDHKLASLCQWLDIPLPDAHDALADVRATVRVAQVLCGRLGIEIGGAG